MLRFCGEYLQNLCQGGNAPCEDLWLLRLGISINIALVESCESSIINWEWANSELQSTVVPSGFVSGETKVAKLNREPPVYQDVKVTVFLQNKTPPSLGGPECATYSFSGQEVSTYIHYRSPCPSSRWDIVVRSRRYRTGNLRTRPPGLISS